MTTEIFNKIETLVNKLGEENVNRHGVKPYKVKPYGFVEDSDLNGMFIYFYDTFYSTDLEEILKLKNEYNLHMFMGNREGWAFIYLQ